MDRDAALAGEDELRGIATFDAGGLGGEPGFVSMHPVAIAVGDMRTDAMLHKDGRQQIDHIFADIPAVDEMLRTLFQQPIQRPPRFGQMVMGIRDQADFHTAPSLALSHPGEQS